MSAPGDLEFAGDFASDCILARWRAGSCSGRAVCCVEGSSRRGDFRWVERKDPPSKNEGGAPGGAEKTRTLPSSEGAAPKGRKAARATRCGSWGLRGDDHVVDVGFAQAGAGDADEAAVGFEIVERGGADIAHAGLQAADELVGERTERSFIGHAAFDAFGDGFATLAVGVVLHGGVAVGAGVHRGGGAHAAIRLEGAPLVEDRLAGGFFVPAKRLPIITQDAPAAMAFVTSPENLIPPSAMIGTPVPSAARAASIIAVSCGTPAPVTTRVVQIEPGPIPTLRPSMPSAIKSRAPS